MLEDHHHTKKVHRFSQQTSIVDHMVQIVNIKTTIQDKIQINPNFRLWTDPIQILEIENIQIIDLETLHTIDIEIILTIGIETIQTIETLDIKIIDHAIIQKADQNKIIIKIDHAIIQRTEAQAITTDKETTLNHDIGKRHVIKIHNKIIVSNTPKHQRQINQVQLTEETQPDTPPGIDNNDRTELQLNNINCEITDSETQYRKPNFN